MRPRTIRHEHQPSSSVVRRPSGGTARESAARLAPFAELELRLDADVLAPPALTSVRSAAAVRPCRPITRPRSPGAIVSSTSVSAAVIGFGRPDALGLVGQRARDDLDEILQADAAFVSSLRAFLRLEVLVAHDAAGCAPAAGGRRARAGLRATSVRSVSDGCAPLLTQ